ncbi:hypothetical protein F5884DRAFT_259932 [Xylogone sp. PMI_703]|nr:hypothetical protein F5884DRAFT_259932 [Xylogone sp. PMI_703]
MGQLNQRGDIDIAAFAVYTPLGLAALYMLPGGIRRGVGLCLAYLTVFILLKLVGAAMAVDTQATDNTSLATPATIISTVVLAPLLSAAQAAANWQLNSKASGNSHLDSYHIQLLPRLNHVLILASLILGIVGGIDVFSTSSTCRTNSDCTGLALLRAAAGLSIAAWAVTVATLAYAPSQRYNSTNRRTLPRHSMPALAVALVLLMARLVYTVGVAATIDTDRTQIFNPLTGSWVLYLCIAWLPELGASVAVLVAVMEGF